MQVRQLEMERFSMNKAVATDKGAASRMKTLDKQLTELKGQQGVRLKSPSILSLEPRTSVAKTVCLSSDGQEM